MIPKPTATKDKKRHIGLHQSQQHLCFNGHYQISEKTTQRMEENIFKSYTGKDFLSQICEEPLKFNNKRPINFILKWVNDPHGLSLRRIYQWPVNT